MDSLGNILNKQKFSEPPEMKAIKAFIKKHYDSDSIIKVEDNRIVIQVSNSALASSLFSDIVKLQEVSGTDKKILIRTG